MFLDCTKRKISPDDEFAVSIGDLIYHGIVIEPLELALEPEKGEDLLVIECLCEYAGIDDFLLNLVYRSKKGEKKILPNVLIWPGTDIESNPNSDDVSPESK